MGANKGGFLSFLVGAAAGMAAGFWLNSERGRDWRKEAVARAQSKGADLKAKADEAVEKFGERISETADKLRDKAAETVKDLKGKYRDKLKRKNTSREAFEAGSQRAKERLSDAEAAAGEAQL